MKCHTYCLAMAMWLAFSLPTATADVLKYGFSLDGASESPPNASPGTGTALVTIDTVLATMRVQAEFSGLVGTTTAAHIHCCDLDPVLLTAGVATQTPSFAGFPSGVTSGTMDNTFDMTLAGSYRAAFLTANGGSTANAFNSLLGGLDSGIAYFNIHSSSFGGGEIRGFAVAIPEPSAAMLIALGCLASAPWWGRRICYKS